MIKMPIVKGLCICRGPRLKGYSDVFIGIRFKVIMIRSTAG
jgi:hypothetical protein